MHRGRERERERVSFFLPKTNLTHTRMLDFVDWSKDYGKTWTSSKIVHGLGECSIAFLKSPDDGEIIMNCRTGSHARAQLTWSKDGVPSQVVGVVASVYDLYGMGEGAVIHFIAYVYILLCFYCCNALLPNVQTFPAGLIDPGCQGSIVSVPGENGTTLYLSNANTTSSRTHMSIKSSSDGGKTWNQGKLVWAGPSACTFCLSVMDYSTSRVLLRLSTQSTS